MGCGGAKLNPEVMSLEHFAVERVVGEGGFGKVNAAERNTTNKLYAIKKLTKLTVLQNNSIAMIFNERDLLTRVAHDFIINMHFAFQDKEACYLVMDLLLGGDLRFHLKFEWPDNCKGINDRKDRGGAGFEEPRVAFYVASIILALDYLHSIKILHRDIKPENVVLGTDGYPALTDLGISTLCDSDEMTCKLGSGTKPYMAPEQLTKGRVHGIAADYWQLGITMHELLTGRRPHSSVPKNIVEKIPGDGSPADVSNLTVNTNVNRCSADAQDLTAKLLAVGHWERLGRSRQDVADNLKSHAFFASIDWAALQAKTFPACFKPNVDVANCDTGTTDLADSLMEEEEVALPAEKDQERFNGYEYNTDLTQPLKGKAGEG